MDDTFSSTYRCRELCELPSPARLPLFYYPGANIVGGGDGVLVEIQPEIGQPWIGVFAFERLSHRAISGIYATPDPQRLCIIARGAAYLVHAHEPTSWEYVPMTPVLDAHCVSSHGILVFAGFTDLIAYDRSGVKWRTERLSFDDLRITEINDEVIKGEFSDPRSDMISSFAVDLATGKQQGGAFC